MVEWDDYSRRFAKVLFDGFPEWRQFAANNNPNENSFLVVKIPVPTGGKKLLPSENDFLTIDCDGEITIAYDFHHTHFDAYAGAVETEEFSGAIEYLKEIVNEKIIMVAVFAGESFCGSTSWNTNEEVNLSAWNWLDKSVCKDVFIRSWKGTYNKKLTIEKVLQGVKL